MERLSSFEQGRVNNALNMYADGQMGGLLALMCKAYTEVASDNIRQFQELRMLRRNHEALKKAHYATWCFRLRNWWMEHFPRREIFSD